MTLSLNSRSKPLVTASTTVSDETPRTTPMVATVVNTENTRKRANKTAEKPATKVDTVATVSAPRWWPRDRNTPKSESSMPPAAIQSPTRVRRPCRDFRK